MRRCAFLIMQEPEGWAIDAGLAIPHLESRGWSVDWVTWQSENVDWHIYDVVYLGVAWDYPTDPQRFLAVLEAIQAAGARLVNPLSIARWNMDKRYLRELEQHGVDIVPTAWLDDAGSIDLERLLEQFATNRIVIKPAIGTNAADCFVLTAENWRSQQAAVGATFSKRPLLAQPFIDAVQSEGEYSLFYLNAVLSHAICKKPLDGDYRVQEEHGGSLTAVQPGRAMRDAGQRVVDQVTPLPMYARCDLIRGEDGRFLLMELELIEPSLYLRLDDAAPERFAVAFEKYLARDDVRAIVS